MRRQSVDVASVRAGAETTTTRGKKLKNKINQKEKERERERKEATEVNKRRQCFTRVCNSLLKVNGKPARE